MNEFFTKSGTIVRQEWVGDISNEAVVATIKGHLQPGIGKYSESITQGMTKPHIWWCDEDSDIIEGDEITIDSSKYSVKYISKWNVEDEDDHLEVLLEEL